MILDSPAPLLTIRSGDVSRVLEGRTDYVFVVDDWVVDDLIQRGYVDLSVGYCGWRKRDECLSTLLSLL